MFAHDGTHRRMLAAVLAFAVPAFLLTACNDDPLFEIPPDAPTGVAVAVQGTSATVTWTPGAGATSQEVRMSPVVAVPASAGTVLLVEDDHVQTFADNTTSSALFENLTEGTSYSTTVTAINGSSRTSSEAQTVVILPPSTAPILTAFYEDELDPTCLVVEWTGVEGAENYAVSLTSDGNDPITDVFPASASSANMCAEFYDIMDGVTYTAQVGAVFGTETELSNTMSYMTDFFPWDDYFATSLHETGAGKTTFYNTTPNQGFERFTEVPYSELACQGCHSAASGLAPVNGRGCDRCHDTADPGLGDEVNSGWDDGVCLGCHSRQTLEVNLGYSDVHRDAGFDCMTCHTLEDVHGDGNEYDGLMEVGAIDAACTNCHNEDNSFTHPAGTDPHAGAVACAACHAQTSVTCNNCHFEAQVPPITGKFFLTPPAHGWMWLGNRMKRDGSGETEVYPINYQSVEYGDNTFVAFGFYTPHTIGAGRVCSACHSDADNPAIQQYNAEGIIDVASWDEGTSTMTYPTGVIPMPEDYLTALKFDFVTTDDGGSTWTFLKAGADTIQVIEEYMTPLSFDQMAKIGVEPPTP